MPADGNPPSESGVGGPAVAFRRATMEHAFGVAKTEAGLTHFEGRKSVRRMRHLIVLRFVAVHTERLRGEIRR
jgi:hypothetical protein